VADLKIGGALQIEAEDVTIEGAEGVTIRWLISKNDGATRFQMRLFEVATGGRTPLHTHEWEHEVFILEGEGILTFEGIEHAFSAGHFVFVPEGREHSFRNSGEGRMTFLCMVPV
jgi:quercetin dioxygenase-like cupin family protein